MSDAPRPGVVVDTMVISWLFDERPNPVADLYRVLIGRAPVVLAFHTVRSFVSVRYELGGESYDVAGSSGVSRSYLSSSPTTR